MPKFITSAPICQTNPLLPWWKKLLLAAVVVGLFFTTLEAGLWLLGVKTLIADEDPYVGFADTLPLFVTETTADGSVWMRTADNKLAWFNDQRFPRDKPPETRRAFCLGGSTTYGHPYDDTSSFAAWLRALLPAAAPQVQWEVINAGGISYASYRAAALVEELIQYEPDLFIVYTGNNEFLEERSYGQLRRTPGPLLRASALLARTHTFSAARRLVQGLQTSGQQTVLAAEVDAVLDHTVGPDSYQRDDDQREQIREHFEFNLARMSALARSAGAELVLVVPAVNLRDCSPFKSELDQSLAESEINRWQQYQSQGQQLQQQGRFEEALLAYQNALQIDPRHAESHFRTGRLLWQLGRTAEASGALQRAVDEDVCALRIPADFQQSIRQVARAVQATLVDFDQSLRNQTLTSQGHNLPGEESFLDHVHLTIGGYRDLAVAIIQQLARDDVLQVGSLDPVAIEQATERIESRIDRQQHGVAERNLAKVLNWAGKHQQAGRLALGALEKLPDDPESLVIAGAYVRHEGDLQRGLQLLERAVEQLPDYAEARQLFGAMLVDAGRLDDALEQFLALASLREGDAAAWRMVGAIRVEQQRPGEALPYLQRSLELADDPETHLQLAIAFRQLDQPHQARQHLQQVRRQNPDDVDAQQMLDAMGAPSSNAGSVND